VNATQSINHVWKHLQALADEAQRFSSRTAADSLAPLTDRSSALASAALEYAAAHLESLHEGDNAARLLRGWAADFRDVERAVHGGSVR
jgi:hypothetical protein